MIGTDMAEFGVLELAGAPIDLPLHWFPMYVYDTATYTPLEELPASTRELYDYNPDKAKQMLADAGYPDGFKLECGFTSVALGQDRASLLKAQWAKIGVEVDIISVESALQTKMGFDRDYKHVWGDDIETANPVLTLRQAGETGHFLNITTSEDAFFDEMASQIVTEIDPIKRASLMKEAGNYVLGQVYSIPLNTRPSASYWWPWVKNYYGEANVGDWGSFMPLLATVWIDEALKAEMGY